MSANQTRVHWRVMAEHAKLWRAAAHWGAVNCLDGGPAARVLPPCDVRVTLPVIGKRRRDASNYHVTVKPIIDGLVDAGVWPDDTAAWADVLQPVLVAVRSRDDGTVIVTLTPMEAP